MLGQVFCWIWGILAVGTTVAMSIDLSVQGHLHGGSSMERDSAWCWLLCLTIFLPIVLAVIPLALLLWLCHLLIGVILKRMGIKK